MKLNTQICTTKIQSKRLLALGLKAETADCIWCEVRALSKDNPIQWRLLPEYIDKYMKSMSQHGHFIGCYASCLKNISMI